jgi:short subunit fatty acids transporter
VTRIATNTRFAGLAFLLAAAITTAATVGGGNWK